MLPKWKRRTGRYILKIQHRNMYLATAGSCDNGSGEGRPCAKTTMRISEAMGFETVRSAERMARLLNERYGLESEIVERKAANA